MVGSVGAGGGTSTALTTGDNRFTAALNSASANSTRINTGGSTTGASGAGTIGATSEADGTQQVALNVTPGDVLDFARSALGGFAWAGSRQIGGYKITIAAITPRREGVNDVFQGDDLASALGNLAVNAGEALVPNPTTATFFISITGPAEGATPLILTWKPGQAMEVGTTLIPPTAFLPGNGDTQLFFSNARVNLGNAEVSSNSGALLRAPVLEKAMNFVADKLLTFAANTMARSAFSGPQGLLVGGALAAISGIAGFALDGWKTFWGPVWRSTVDINPTDFGSSSFSFNGRRITLNEIGLAMAQFARDGINALAGPLRNIGFPGPQYDMDQMLLTLRDLPAGAEGPSNVSQRLGYQTTEALNAGVDAFSLLDTAWRVWDSRSTGANMRLNAADIFQSNDPRMALGRAFIASFYAQGARDGNLNNVRFTLGNEAARDAFVQRDDLVLRSRDAFGELTVRNIKNVLRNAREYWGAEEYQARLTTFAREMTRLGLNVNFGDEDLWAAAKNARQALPQARPAESAQEITSYFARNDLQRATTTFLSQGGPEVPVLTAAEATELVASQGASAASNPVFEEVAGGRVDLFTAQPRMQASGAADDAQTQSDAKLRADLEALLTAPIANSED
jgi:hypothetical protein